MLSVPIYNRAGEQVGEESIDPADFGGQVNKQLLHEVVLMHLANRRVGTVNTRGRSDVAGSTKKLFRQKGTGNARAGSKRTNKRVGGGVAFARRNRDYRYALPKKAVRAAIRMAILSKFQDGQALIIDGLAAGEKPKTKEIATVLGSIRRPDVSEGTNFSALTPEAIEHKRRSGKLGGRLKERIEAEDARETPAEESKTTARKRMLCGSTVLIGLPGPDKTLYLSARNIEGVQVAPVSEFNTYDVLKQRYLVLTREALTALKEKVKEPIRRRPEPAATA
jgi:large subunit ribosomal protein L4